MRAAGIVALLFVLPLTGCKAQDDLPPGYWFPTPFTPTKQELAAAKAEWAAKDDETCKSYGAKPGTDIYIQCRMTQQQTRDAADNGLAASAPGPANTGVPASDAPRLRNSIPPTVRCQTLGTQTVCR